jgi:peptidase E
MKYIIDIDGTICSQMSSGEYENAQPYMDRIEHINKLFNDGNEIVYWTARGMHSNKDYSELTEKQLKLWGCKYTELKMNKPSYDVWVDDKANWIFE